MNYIVSEEELIRLKNASVYMMTREDTCKTATEKVVKDFLKSHEPVEMIASGEVSEVNLDSCIVVKKMIMLNLMKYLDILMANKLKYI
jgi:hypothetical protein